VVARNRVKQGHRKDPGKRAVKAVMTAPVPEYRYKGSEREAARLLTAVADALNACEAAGILAGLAHGALISNQGYVLPIGGGDVPLAGERWVVRTKTMTEFPVPPSFGDED
jgi:hypothetical protein